VASGDKTETERKWLGTRELVPPASAFLMKVQAGERKSFVMELRLISPQIHAS
jgi:hypothetical protein